MFEYDAAAMIAANKLDEYDLTEILKDCYKSKIREAWIIKDKISDSIKELEQHLDDLSLYEFMDYLCDRYPVSFEEVCTYRMWYRERK